MITIESLDLPKPWLDTPLVKDVITDDLFLWLIKASLADCHAMLRQSNSKPSPGPDGWTGGYHFYD